jgi:glyoxylase-like metal-dependent hydrolase (beta-lactamase superfamily II)
MEFKVLFTGEHTNYDRGSCYEISPLTSSVSLLRDGETVILFDTGSAIYKNKLLEALEENGLAPEDITHVMLTHFHLDHTANCNLFMNAEIHANRSFIDHKTGDGFVYRNFDDKVLPLGIKCVATPGHTEDHVSYFFEYDDKVICIGGDAVRQDTIRDGGAPHYYDQDRAKLFKASLKLIFERADVIVPGHFDVIEGELKEELERLM